MNYHKRFTFLMFCFLVISLPLFARHGDGEAGEAIGKGIIMVIFLLIFRGIVSAIKSSKNKNNFTRED